LSHLRWLPRLAACLLAVLTLATGDAAADDLIELLATPESVWNAQISTDGKQVALGCTNQRARAVCIYQLDAADQPPQIIALPAEQSLLTFSWLDADWLLLEVGQAQYGQAARIWRFERSRLARNIRTGQTSMLGLADIAALVPDAPGEVLVRWQRGVLRTDLARDGRIKQRERFRSQTIHAWFDAHAEQVLALRTNRTRTRFFALSGKSAKPVPLELGYPLDNDHPAPSWVGIANAGKRLGAIGYLDGDYVRYQEFDTQTGLRLPSDSRLPADRDIDRAITAAASDEVLGVSYTRDVPRQVFFDPELDAIHSSVGKALGDQVVSVLSWTRDRSAATLSSASPGASESFYIFDRTSAGLTQLGEARPRLARLPKSTTTVLRYPAPDRLPIEAFLTLPPGKLASDGPFPMIVMSRQHVRARDDARFNWWVEFLAQRGYAVLRPNVRGATGYGKAFMDKGAGGISGSMIEDFVEAARFAIGAELADRKRVCFAGIGYGGYAALMASLREPDLTRCVIAVNAVTDPVAMYDHALRYCAADSDLLSDWHGHLVTRNPLTAEATAISPALNAWRFSVPLLLVHDTRETPTTKSQALQMKKQMELYHRSPQLVAFEAGDPLLLTAQARHAVLAASDEFLATHLGRMNAE
jgi:dipeptidyl aminopeptidase/acylaminoacyl peptidase